MLARVHRFGHLEKSTIGAVYVDHRWSCFSLEDQHQEIKIPGETRIPAGLYKVALRAEGRLHEKYAALYPEHRGMLWIQNVPNFEFIYFHKGSTDDHTEGCILLADTAHAGGSLNDSESAYRRFYGQLSNAILAGEPVEVLVEDFAP